MAEEAGIIIDDEKNEGNNEEIKTKGITSFGSRGLRYNEAFGEDLTTPTESMVRCYIIASFVIYINIMDQ